MILVVEMNQKFLMMILIGIYVLVDLESVFLYEPSLLLHFDYVYRLLCVSTHQCRVLNQSLIKTLKSDFLPIFDDRSPSSNNWLVPTRPVDEQKLKKNFDPDTVSTSVVPSPLYGIRGLLRFDMK